ncbi:MAG: hypothetical protein R2795_12600 [Saprospiraceae bacterium]
MSFFERWFSNKDAITQQPTVRFGRYSDSYKPTSCYDAWDKALAFYEKEEYLQAIKQLLVFLRDEEEDNVHWQDEGSFINFELYQGSKRVIGWATLHGVRVEARVARISTPRPELLRRLVEHNYSLKFSRYAIDPDHHVTVVFDSKAIDASPYKLYYAIRELATQADKQDDLLLEEFQQIEAVDSSHLAALPEQERQIKHQYIHDQIRTALEEVYKGPLNGEEYPGGIACLLLSVVYKIDYLTKPEGFTMETLERIHRRFFSKEKALSPVQQNRMMVEELENLLARSGNDYSREMYQVKATFGITAPVTHDRIVSMIDAEMPQMDWYHRKGFLRIAHAYPFYMLGYCLFNYAVPQPDRDFFHLYFRTAEPAYFQALGFSPAYYDAATGKFNTRLIKKTIEQIVQQHKKRYPNLRPAVSSIVYNDMLSFSRSFLLMIRDLDLTRID